MYVSCCSIKFFLHGNRSLKEKRRIVRSLKDRVKRLNADHIFPQRYFYPSLNTVSIFKPQTALPVSERIAQLILCLPLYDSLVSDEIRRICDHFKED